MMELKDLLGW